MRLVIAHMYGIAGRRSELVTLLADAERAATSDAGCLRYAATATVADPNHFVVVEEWHDDAAVEAHYASRRFERFQYALHGLLARPSEATIYSVDSAHRPLASAVMDPRDAD